MWIFATLGFLSVVAHRDDETALLIRAQARARARGDLEALRVEALRDRHLPGHDILEWEGSDYRNRLVASREDWARVAGELGAGLDYADFKDAVAGRQGMSRARLYSRVWQAMFALQGGAP